MKGLIFTYSFLGLLLLAHFADAQRRREQDIDMEAFIEEFFPVQDEDINYEDVYESLLQLYLNPVNLNRADRSQLQSLFILSEKQINAFFEYIALNGRLLSIYELQAIPEWDINTIRRVLPVVEVRETGYEADTRPLWQRIINERNNYLVLRADQVLEQRRGFSPADTLSDGSLSNRYLGSPQRYYARFRVSHLNDFSLGFTTEKDAGEQLRWDPSNEQYGMDFWSFHLQLQNKGRLKNMVIGDYQLQFGQSLILGAGFAVGKGAETIATARRSNLGIRPYTSVLETGYFRGGAATYELSKNIDITAFYSYNYLNGTVVIDTLDNVEDFFSAINLTGFHRTPSELSRKNQIVEQTGGANALYTNDKKNFQVGLTYVHTFYDRPLNRIQRRYTQYEFNGDENFNAGAFFNYSWQNFYFFGEGAISKSMGTGLITGFIASLTSDLQTSLVYRNYARDFHAFYGNAFGESARNINEEGLFWGLKYSPGRSFTWSMYFDQFRFPWLRFRIDTPSTGNEFLSRWTYRFSRSIIIYGQIRQENKARNFTHPDAKVNLVGNGQRRNVLLNLDYKIDRIFTFKSRVQASSYSLGEDFTTGFALMQDVNADIGQWRLSSRVALFDTEDFENRQFAYERDVLYFFSIPAYYGQGIRTYLLAQYKMSRKFTMWARVARTRYTDRNTIGTGLETIDGNIRTDVRLQLMYRF